MWHKRTFGALLAFALVLAACGPAGTTTAPADGSEPGTASEEPSDVEQVLRIPLGGEPATLDPNRASDSVSITVLTQLVRPLVYYDQQLNTVSEGGLAESWELSPDGTVVTFTLKEGLTYSNGDPIVAEDFVFSWKRLIDPRTAADYSYVLLDVAGGAEVYGADPEDDAAVEAALENFGVEATDERTVVLTTEEPINTFEPYLAFLYVLPQHVWEAEDDPVAFENAEMIGSGPFKLVEASQGEFIQLEANTDYWATPANVDGVIFQTYSNADARVQALTTGEVDAITEFPATAVSTLQNTDGVTVHVADIAAGGSFRDYFFNVVSDEDCPEEDGHPALKDVDVRRALAHAVDKQQIIDVATLGTGSPGLSVVPPGLGDYYASEVQDYAFDVAEANRLLDEAGYEDADGDGVRECLADQDCETLTFRFHYADDIDTAPREAELLQAMWGEIGVAIEIQGLDPDALTSICCPTFDYDIILWGWGSDPDPGFLLGVALCSEIPTGFSETGYCNPEYDELYDAQFIEQDRDARIDMVHEMQQILVDDVPYIIPYYQVSIQAWREDNFTGWLADDPTFGLEDPSWLMQLRPTE